MYIYIYILISSERWNHLIDTIRSNREPQSLATKKMPFTQASVFGSTVLDLIRSEKNMSALRTLMAEYGCSTRRKTLSHFGAVPKRCNSDPQAHDMGNKSFALVMYCLWTMKTCNAIQYVNNSMHLWKYGTDETDDPLTQSKLDHMTVEHLGDVNEALLAPSQISNVKWQSHGKYEWNFDKITSLHREHLIDEGDFQLNIKILKDLAAVEDITKHVALRFLDILLKITAKVINAPQRQFSCMASIYRSVDLELRHFLFGVLIWIGTDNALQKLHQAPVRQLGHLQRGFAALRLWGFDAWGAKEALQLWGFTNLTRPDPPYSATYQKTMENHNFLSGFEHREWMGMGVAGIIINSYYGSFPHSLLSTSK